MELQQKAYMAYSKAMDFQPGDLVKVTHKVASLSGGWANSWYRLMDGYVGKEYFVSTAHRSTGGVRLRSNLHPAHCFAFPAFCLELIERKHAVEAASSPKKESNLMTIEIEEFEDIVKVLWIKNAKDTGFPAGYADVKQPSFSFLDLFGFGTVFSTAEETFSDINPMDTILRERAEYSWLDFDKAMHFLKEAGKRLTKLNRESKGKAVKPKRRTITI